MITPSSVAVVRLPISDLAHRVLGYELRCQLDLTDDSAHATSSLLMQAFADLGLDELCGSLPAWIAVSPEFVAEVHPPPVRPDRCVLQITPGTPVDALRRLSAAGYSLVLRDYDGRPELDRELELCGMVRVTPDTEPKAIRRALAHRAIVVAADVDDADTYVAMRDLGCTVVQGAYLGRPTIVSGRGVSALTTLAELNEPDLSFERLEELISRDLGLSLKLLRYVNSAFFALPRTIGSVREALAILGVRMVRRWASLMALARPTDDRSDLVVLALQRARMCERIAAAGSYRGEQRESLFTVGLFSLADAMLGMPMDQVLRSLPFSDEIAAALLRHEGPKGEILATVIAYEHGDFRVLERTGSTALPGAYREAVAWSTHLGAELAGAHSARV